MLYENIAAISTPLGAGGVAVIRISGESPLSVAEQMFLPAGRTKVRDFVPYRMYTGEIDAGSFRDFGMCVRFAAPKSYTGENMVEFHCHGGVAIAQGILRRALALGCRPAANGEFTRRAFLNGKLSLSSAEGLIDMIGSESEGEVKAGYYLYREGLKNRVEKMQDALTYVLAQIDANIDFPEEDLEDAALGAVREKLSSLCAEIEALIATYRTGRSLKNGVKVAIVGRPNTGKSSLLNRLLNYDKAIVSSVAGTTRDVVEGTMEIEGVRFLLSDTAGIRETENEVESVGIARARRALEESDLVLFVLDGSRPLTEEDRQIFGEIADKNRIVVYNKSDLSGLVKLKEIDLMVSAATGENIGRLKELLYRRALGDRIDLNGDFLTEERHYAALKRALEKLTAARDQAGSVPLDLIAVDLRAGWETLGEISGKTAGEHIIDEIFSNFCVGK